MGRCKDLLGFGSGWLESCVAGRCLFGSFLRA